MVYGNLILIDKKMFVFTISHLSMSPMENYNNDIGVKSGRRRD